ncbi:hypothetical protein ERX37_09600 [Macrococcus hajekii]|uniref:PepSY domain-containing protein n=1 Tax=Macrococcus hajekii TaxID=198482 RepID=A0A4R6BIJ1_9STAP|nr:PepSY domain-containing protein [Macrococcus hajekii]TDM01356.1 hypothetical protein ERX37_09600 [Macrococcus hajekii]GGB10944.1 hypothetical protein GCM10007190_18780 [Macrococcus hajekii]
MKFKILGLILSATLALTACDADNSNDKQTSPDDNAQSEVNSSETNKSSDVKKSDEKNVAKDSDSNDQDASNDAEKDDEGQSTLSANEADKKEALNLEDIKSTPADIIKIVEAQNKKGEITDVKFEKENNRWVYKVAQNEGNKNVEYTYGMSDRKLINTEEDNEKKEAINYNEALSFDKILKNVQDKAGTDTQVKEWELTTEDKVPVFKTELLKDNVEHEYRVDPFKGTVTEKK